MAQIDRRLNIRDLTGRCGFVCSSIRINSLMVTKLVVCLILLNQNAMANEPINEGIKLFNDGRYAEALEILEGIDFDSRNSLEFEYYFGLSLLKNGESERSVEVLENLVARASDRSDFQFALAKAYTGVAQKSNVLRAVRMSRIVKDTLIKAVELDPHNSRALKTLTFFLIDNSRIVGGDEARGLGYLSDLVQIDESAAYEIEAMHAKNNRDYVRTEEYFLKAIDSENPAASTFLQLGKFYIDQSRYAEAIPHLLEFQKLKLHWSESWSPNTGLIFLAVAYYHLNDQENFLLNTQLAETEGVTEDHINVIGSWFEYWDVEYN